MLSKTTSRPEANLSEFRQMRPWPPSTLQYRTKTAENKRNKADRGPIEYSGGSDWPALERATRDGCCSSPVTTSHLSRRCNT
jgi:hypothetical protein